MSDLVTISSQALLVLITVVTSDFVASADHIVGAVPFRAAARLTTVSIAGARFVALEEVRASIVVTAAAVALKVVIAGIACDFLAVQALRGVHTRVVRAAERSLDTVCIALAKDLLIDDRG